MMTTKGGDGDDRLSDLSDDLLRRILYFVPFKEAARTSELSRRWGSLWRSSGAVNLAVQVDDYQRRHAYTYEEAEEALFSDQDAFVGAANAALDAAEAPITRLTLRVDSDDDDRSVSKFLCRGRGWCTAADVVGDLLSHQAARRVEELVVAATAARSSCLYERTGLYRLVSLPSSETLCLLDLNRCHLTLSSAAPAAALRLPRLATLRLSFCTVEGLQALLDAAPELTTVQLESLLFLMPPPPPPPAQQSMPFTVADPEPEFDTASEAEPPVLCLNFHAATMLVLAWCSMQVQVPHGGSADYGGSWAMVIEAPRLQSFTYKGRFMRRFILRPAAAVARVDLHFLHDVADHHHHHHDSEDFWQFLHNFGNARTLRLKVDSDLKNIAAIGKERCARLLYAFPSLERLELEGTHRPKSKRAAVAITNLLHCCPVLGEIMLKLSTGPPLNAKDSEAGLEFLQRKRSLDYNKSIDRFVRHGRKSKTAAISMVDNTFCDKYSYDAVPDIPGLSGCSFACLQRTVRRVGLRFRLDNNNSISSCLGVRLIKFFAGHASVLEEICVDTVNRRLYEHLNFNVVTQIALAPMSVSTIASIPHENLAESSSEFSKIPGASIDSTTDLDRSNVGFTVLPLKRQKRMDCES